MRRIGKEAWILIVVLIVFVAVTARYASRDYGSEQRKQPSSYNTAPGGLAALYRLYERNKLPVRRWERPLTELPDDAGMLVISEPFWRQMSEEEQAALNSWTEAGHTVLYIVAEEVVLRKAPEEEEERSKAVEVIRATAQPGEIAPSKSDSPYLKDVRTLHVNGTIRLSEPGAETLAKDSQGAYIIKSVEGGGETIAVTDGVRIDNGGIAQSDNALLFLNIAEASVGNAEVSESSSGKADPSGMTVSGASSGMTSGQPDSEMAAILFDEYHHGYGAEAGGHSLWLAIGPAARTGALYLLAAFLLIVYNANRRFGAVRHLTTPTSRPSTEYVASMGALYRRAGAAQVALGVIGSAFVRDLSSRLDMPPDTPHHSLATAASRRYGIDNAELSQTLEQGDRARRGERMSEQEMTLAARRIQEYRRQAGLDS